MGVLVCSPDKRKRGFCEAVFGVVKSYRANATE